MAKVLRMLHCFNALLLLICHCFCRFFELSIVLCVLYLHKFTFRMLRISLLLLLVICLSVLAVFPQYPPENRHPLDRFLLVKPYSRSINKFQPLGESLLLFLSVAP